jgi:hypothetical protein
MRTHCDDPNCRNRPRTRARGSNDDRRQIVADLISDDRSPFTPDDETSLRAMTDATLLTMRDRYLGESEPAETGDQLRTMGRPITVSADDPDVAAMTASTSETQLRAYERHERAAEYRGRQALPVVQAVDDPAIAAMTAGETGHREHLRQARELRTAGPKAEALHELLEKKKRSAPARSYGEQFPDQEPA